MKVLLVHPEDNPPLGNSRREWDLVVDLGRAPASTYTRWSAQMGCTVISIYDFAEEIADLRLCREGLQHGAGFLVDRFGIDWWDVLALGIVPVLQQITLFERLSTYIDKPCQFHATRPFRLTTVLRDCGPIKVLGRGSVVLRKKLQHYKHVVANLDAGQMWQIIQDKFDRHHAIRSRVSRRKNTSSIPMILLPSAYVNVSRMAVRLAELLPDQKFLLVFARRNGKLQSLPGNVITTSLDPYFDRENGAESYLVHRWRALKHILVHEQSMFETLERNCILERVESDLQWLLKIRNAWANVLNIETIAGCLSADDTNPYTRIPLLLAKNRGLPTVACHHGALDGWMAVKTLAAKYYLAKSEMERDYLVNLCGVAPDKILAGRAAAAEQPKMRPQPSEKPWIVFFTEAYEASGWRGEEVYKDLLPRLCSLAQNCGLKLILKLHPFDSVRSHRKKLRCILGDQQGEVQLVTGPPTDDLWKKTKFALTGQSSIALECAARGIPVFVCTWLRDPYSGYVQQYEKFGVGYALESPQQLETVPQLWKTSNGASAGWRETIDRESLQVLLSSNISCEAALKPLSPAICAASPIAS